MYLWLGVAFMARRLPAALESFSSFHVYQLWVFALCLVDQGSNVSYTWVIQLPGTILSTGEHFKSAKKNVVHCLNPLCKN